jgi:acylpyruvate hydrolase
MVLMTPDEVGQGGDLALRCEVDGQVVQDARTSDLGFDPIDTVEYISQVLTHEPGDVIATGTPGGVAASRDPSCFLQPGQVVRSVIDGIGVLVNECVAAPERT